MMSSKRKGNIEDLSSRKRQYRQHWKQSYAQDFKYIQKSKKGDAYAFCTLCQSDFTISHSGSYDIRQHEKTRKHQQVQWSRRYAAQRGKVAERYSFFIEEKDIMPTKAAKKRCCTKNVKDSPILPSVGDKEKTLNISTSSSYEILGKTPDKAEHMAEDECILKWTDYQSNLTSVFRDLYNNEHFVDVTLACEDRMFQAHKLVLCACSAYFRNLFIHNPCKHPIVFLKDVKSHHVEALLHFMYHGELSLQQTELMALLKTAQSLQVKGLPHLMSPLRKESRRCESGKDFAVNQSSSVEKVTNEHQKSEILNEELHITSCSHSDAARLSTQDHMQPSTATSALGQSQKKTKDTVNLDHSLPELLVTPVSISGTENASLLAFLEACAESDTSVGGETQTCIQTFTPVSQETVSDWDITETNRNCQPDPGPGTSQQRSVDFEEFQYSDNIGKVKEEVEEMQEFSENWSFKEAMESTGNLSPCPNLGEIQDRYITSINTLNTGQGSSCTQEVSKSGQKQTIPILQYQVPSSYVCKIFERKAPDK